MRMSQRRYRLTLSATSACLALLAPFPLRARAQDITAPERKKMVEILNGVRRDVAERYYDSTYGGMNLHAVYDSAELRIRNAHALDGALAAIAWFTFELHDSHTFFVPPAQTVGVEYGWTSMMIGDSCFVRYVEPESDADRQGVHAGDQVMSINGFTPTRENLWQINYLFSVLRPMGSMHATLRAPGASPRDVDLASKVRERSKIVDLTGSDGGRDIGQLVREGERHADDYRAETLEYGDLVFVWKMPTFKITPDEVRDVMKRARKRKALVLDLRGNSGGYVVTMLELLKQLNRDSVVVGTLHERRKTTSLTAKGARDDAFTGPLYVLVDSRSASASEILARAVQLTQRGRVLGDRTAGAVMQAQMRGLGLGMETRIFYGSQVTTADIVMSDGGRLEHVGVAPDDRLLPTAIDLATRRDPVLAKALTLAGLPTDAEKAGRLYTHSTH